MSSGPAGRRIVGAVRQHDADLNIGIDLLRIRLDLGIAQELMMNRDILILDQILGFIPQNSQRLKRTILNQVRLVKRNPVFDEIAVAV